MLLYSAADLLWATRIKSAADALSIPARPVRNLDMLESRLADSAPIAALILDLDSPATALSLISRLRAPEATPAERSIHILAFGPHIATDLLAAAKHAGADTVMPRGAFAAGIRDILRQFA